MKNLILSSLIALLSVSAYANDITVAKDTLKKPNSKFDSTWSIQSPDFKPAVIHNLSGTFLTTVISVDRYAGTMGPSDSVYVLCNSQTTLVAPGEFAICKSGQDIQISDAASASKNGSEGSVSITN